MVQYTPILDLLLCEPVVVTEEDQCRLEYVMSHILVLLLP